MLAAIKFATSAGVLPAATVYVPIVVFILNGTLTN